MGLFVFNLPFWLIPISLPPLPSYSVYCVLHIIHRPLWAGIAHIAAAVATAAADATTTVWLIFRVRFEIR